MASIDDIKVIERFHIAFLDVLSGRLEPSRFVLKGGANLRFFYGSVRYSEDLDMDVVSGMPWSLERQVDLVLESGAIDLLLRHSGCSVVECTKPKQTSTTRRWKVGIREQGEQTLVRTKVEFSARNGDARYEVDRIPDRVVEPLAMRAPMVQHYLAGAAIEQKIRALAGRSATQARDVFDLDLLLRGSSMSGRAVAARNVEQAVERAMELPFDAFRDQVLPFLDGEAMELYDGPGAWEDMRAYVTRRLVEAI